MIKDGKLFGKLNIIDLLVIIIAIAVVVAVGLKLSGHGGSNGQETGGVDVVYTVKVPLVEPEVADSIQNFITQAQAQGKPGDQLMAGGNYVDAYVTQMTSAPSTSAGLYFSDGSMAAAAQTDKLDLVFTIVGKANNYMATQVGSQEVRVGRPHIVKTTHFELQNGTTLTCQWKDAN